MAAIELAKKPENKGKLIVVRASYPSVFSAYRIKFLIVCSICTRFEFLACVVNCETSWLFIILLLVCWIFRPFTQVSGSDTCHLSCLKS